MDLKVVQCPECKKIRIKPFNKFIPIERLPKELQLWLNYELNKLRIKSEFCPECYIHIHRLLKSYGKPFPLSK